MRRILLIVLDGLGIGELPDAAEYGDKGSNTLKNMADAAGGVKLPGLELLGLGYLGDFRGIGRPDRLKGSCGKMAEASKAKDTTSGHWEMMGVPVSRPFPTYPEGFPPEIIHAFEAAIGSRTLGNRPASGTEIIKELGAEHIKTGHPIVYTSADSVFQVAVHEKVIPAEELYAMCETARGILKHPHNVCRVIARPFTGEEGSFTRTSGRKDFSIPPPEKTALEYMAENGMEVVGIGKVKDIFAGKGFTKSVQVSGNDDSVTKAIKSFMAIEKGLVFATLVDFDTLYGHRNNPHGYAKALEAFDRRLPEVFDAVGRNDLLILTADHGCDPTTPGTDHSREYVPLLVYSTSIKQGVILGTRAGFSDIGATILETSGITNSLRGKSFWPEVRRFTP